jgi:DNA-binding NtrC family response regulator
VESKPPDVIVVGAVWPERALLRAQLVEDGYEVIAIDAWPIPRLYRQPGMKPRVLLIDLHQLPRPRETLHEARLVLPSDRVIVMTALGSLAVEEVRALGFNVVERPASIGHIVATIGQLLSRAAAEESRHRSPRGE